MNVRHDGVTPGETLLRMIERKETHTEEFKDLVKFFGMENCERMMEKARQDRVSGLTVEKCVGLSAKQIIDNNASEIIFNALKSTNPDVAIKSVDKPKEEVREPEEFEF